MKILILTGMLSYRGTGIYTLNLAEELHTKGHSIRIICAGGALLSEFTALKIPVEVLPSLMQPLDKVFVLQQLLKGLDDDIPDIIHSHNPYLAGLTARLAQRLIKPYCITVPHIQMIPNKLKINKKWIRNIIVTSESTREYLVNETKIPKELIEIIYAGVNLKRLKPVNLVRSEVTKHGKIGETISDITVDASNGVNISGKEKTSPVIGIIGPLEEWRGHQDFLLAAKEVISSGYAAQFLIIGEGPLESDLRQLVISLEIQKSVVFIPSITAYYQILPTVDVFVFPFLQLGMGITLIEAMALAKPVIVSAIGDVYKLVKDGETGWLIPPKNPQAIKEKIIYALKNQKQSAEMGLKAQSFVKSNLSAQQMAERTIALYQKALGG